MFFPSLLLVSYFNQYPSGLFGTYPLQPADCILLTPNHRFLHWRPLSLCVGPVLAELEVPCTGDAQEVHKVDEAIV